MTPARVIASVAALLTALLLQAMLLSPLVTELPVSLPAVLVAAVALHDGPGSGLAFGFTSGLIADLASQHPAGLLALSWMLLGVGCGCAARRGASLRRDAVVAAAGATAAALLAGLLAAALATEAGAVRPLVHALPAALGIDVLLAVLLIGPTRWLLGSDRLRAPRPVLVLGGSP